MTPQLIESAKRAAILVIAIVVAGLIPLYPQILSDAPLNRDAMIRAFVGGVVGALISRFGEGLYDGNRNVTGNVIKGDVAPK